MGRADQSRGSALGAARLLRGAGARVSRAIAVRAGRRFARAVTRGRARLAAMIEMITPILRVESLAASRAYYVDVLGFALDWEADGMASVSRDRCAIMLCERAQGQRGTWLWI